MRAAIIRARSLSFSVSFSSARHIPESTAPSALAAVICMNDDTSPPSESFLGASLPFTVSFVWGATAAPRSGFSPTDIPAGSAATNPPATTLPRISDTTTTIRTEPMLVCPSNAIQLKRTPSFDPFTREKRPH
jgi:hypothetical protein